MKQRHKITCSKHQNKYWTTVGPEEDREARARQSEEQRGRTSGSRQANTRETPT